MKKITSVFALIFTFAALSVLSVTAQSFAPRASVTPLTLEQKANKELRKLPRYSVFDYIEVEVNGSTVTLTGKVCSLGTKNQAANFIKDIDGVREVINNIDELPPSSFDNRIRREAYHTFTNRGPGQYFSEINPDVRIIVERGRITLEGFVYRKADSDTLNILANGIDGVFQVTNNLIVGKRDY
ncbi:MAG: BON domain-containing protein [Chloracidobacterium sp.]|nr:BON domain-containing protein [Chloracidobacterium sp.]